MYIPTITFMVVTEVDVAALYIQGSNRVLAAITVYL